MKKIAAGVLAGVIVTSLALWVIEQVALTIYERSAQVRAIPTD